MVKKADRRWQAARLVLMLGGASALSIGLATAAAAQTAAPESAPTLGAPTAGETVESAISEEVGLADIVVTARKIEENLQDVPVSVTAFTGSQLEQSGVWNLRDVALFTPGFGTREGPSNATALILAMRGQVQTDVLATLEPSVGVYLDGMYVARAYGLQTDLLDIQTVQVLRGPQGTLFGRNTTGGALLLQTNDPSLREVSGLAQITYGNYNQFIGTGVLNVPLGDKFAVRGAFQYDRRDGYIWNPLTDAHYNNRDQIQGRAKLLFAPTDNVELVLMGQWYTFKTDGPVRVNRFAGPTWNPNRPAVTAQQQYFLDNPDTATPSIAPYNDTNTQTYIGTLRVGTNFGEVKLIAGWRSIESSNEIDLDGLLINRHVTQGFQQLNQFNIDLQMAGKGAGDKLDFVVGATYFDEDGFDKSRSQTNGAPTWTQFNGIIDNKSMGVYAQFGWHFNDKLSAVGGLRWSTDTKGVQTQSGVFLNNTTLIVCLPTNYPVRVTNCVRGRKDTWSNVSYTVGLNYQVTDDLLFYVKQSTGYRAGAQQLRSLTFTDTTPAQPETLGEQEIGMKSQWWDNRLRINVSGYHNHLNDAQRTVLQSVNGVAQTLLENANVTNWGMEGDITVVVLEGLTLGISGSYNYPNYTYYQGWLQGTCCFDKTSSRFDGLSDGQFSLIANYERPVDWGLFTANVSYAWVGTQPTNAESVTTLTQQVTNAPPPYSVANAQLIVDDTTKPSAGFLNARVALAFGRDESFEVALWGRNILDTRVFVHGLFVTAPNDYVSSIRNDPATYGITGTFRF